MWNVKINHKILFFNILFIQNKENEQTNQNKTELLLNFIKVFLPVGGKTANSVKKINSGNKFELVFILYIISPSRPV